MNAMLKSGRGTRMNDVELFFELKNMLLSSHKSPIRDRNAKMRIFTNQNV